MCRLATTAATVTYEAIVNFWDQRYEIDTFYYGTAPNDFLREHVGDLPAGGRVLCIGEGEGRNAVFLAKHGFVVTAVDMSRVGMEKLQRLAAQEHVQVTTIVANLAEFAIVPGAWDAIIAIWCHLPQPLRAQVHSACVSGLASGGVFLLEAYTPRQLEFGTGGPQVVEMLMTADALRKELAGLKPHILAEIERDVAEGAGHLGHSAVVQVLARKA